MPVDPQIHNPGDPLDLSSELFKKGLAGRVSGPVEAATTVDTEAEGEVPLGVSNIAPPTAVSAADDILNSGEADVTFTFPAGITTVEIIMVRDDTGAFLKKLDSTGSPQAVTGLPLTTVRFSVRGIDAAGRVGRSAAPVTATVT